MLQKKKGQESNGKSNRIKVSLGKNEEQEQYIEDFLLSLFNTWFSRKKWWHQTLSIYEVCKYTREQ